MPESHRCLSQIRYLLFVAMIIGCESEKIGNNFGPVTAEQLVGMTCRGLQGAPGDFDFKWSFEAKTFEIEGPDIPPYLLSPMLGPEASASSIQGTWEIKSGNIHLVVATDDTEIEPRECSMRIFRTPIIRIQTSDGQCLFREEDDDNSR